MRRVLAARAALAGVLGAALGAGLAVGCAGAPAPRTAARAVAPPRVPVVLVPGVSGTELRERATGRAVWGTGARVIVPHDGGYASALPLAGDDPATSRLVAGRVIEEIRLAGVIRKPVYGVVLAALEEAGYRRGDLDRPRPGDTLFTFAYDWRRSNVESARLLREKLEALGRARGEEPLRVALVCQSNGAHLCRYLAKYGGAPLGEAEAGRAGPPPALAITRLVLVGSSNGGSLRILRTLNRGRQWVPLVGRTLFPETLFTYRSLFEDLPAYRRDLFVDGAGDPLDVDLYDAASWERFGWSIHGEKAARRLARGVRPDLFGTAAARAAYLREALARARRFQDLLARDAPGFGAVRYYLLQCVATETPERAVLARKGGRWRTRFTGDRAVDRDAALHARTTASGDGHATRESQLWLSPQERAALAAEPFTVVGGHFELILEPAALRRLVEFLEE
jgi:hypothetical protein